ncbi:MAG: phosphoglucosamine mutase [Acidimicrobiaceae bacterium]|nr:phosphoglucosamine mutase [Acidimicrobiaceae bacterium]MDE0608054.1 phosphoglucosamine mutase [Acidimicrobiaceae bacterium]
MSLRFGTDGVRGDTRTLLSAQAVAALGRAGADVLGGEGFAVGRDTRASSPTLAAAIHGGIAVAGGHSVDLGVVPTPAVARWSHDNGVAGAVVSASHNPAHDNGVKFFAAGGMKLSEDAQQEIQQRFDQYLTEGGTVVEGAGADRHPEAVERHLAAVVASLDGRSLKGLSVVADLANGAATTVVQRALTELGAEVVVIHNSPDGHNINDGCGSTDLASLQAAVVSGGADVGLGFDGDADRVLAVDASGELVDGDQIIAICALDRCARRMLTDNAVVVTAMTNLGFRLAMDAAGIEVVDTRVGDRYVLEALNARGLSLGGEQSGHVIFRDLATTGDGLLTAVQLLDVVVRRNESLADLAGRAMTRLPQVLSNIVVPKLISEQQAQQLDRECAPLIDAAMARLAPKGRILIRPSGTEPLVRVMVEAETVTEAQMEADALADAVTLLLT